MGSAEREEISIALNEAEKDGWTDRDALSRQHGPQICPSCVSTALPCEGADEDFALVKVLVGMASIRQHVVVNRVGDVAAAEDRHVEREESGSRQRILRQHEAKNAVHIDRTKDLQLERRAEGFGGRVGVGDPARGDLKRRTSV